MFDYIVIVVINLLLLMGWLPVWIYVYVVVICVLWFVSGGLLLALVTRFGECVLMIVWLYVGSLVLSLIVLYMNWLLLFGLFCFNVIRDLLFVCLMVDTLFFPCVRLYWFVLLWVFIAFAVWDACVQLDLLMFGFLLV